MFVFKTHLENLFEVEQNFNENKIKQETFMWLKNHQWHFDYVRLARDTGFSFEKTKSPLDKNKICMIDIDRISTEADVGTIEQFIPSIVQYNVETGEQAALIDQNFLKLFRMSQFAVEYLLFCKKYLDNTVTLLKEELTNFKLENNELKIFNDELKDHTDALLAKLKSQDLACTFRCSKCPKAFSTEQYLAAHVDRRHFDTKDMKNYGLDIETEIKEIKEKLNNTEKLIKNEEMNPKLEDTLNKNCSKVSELLVKFELLKSQLESDFKILQTQKDFEEKYSKIFQSVLDKAKHQVSNELGVGTPYRFHEKRNSVTQTDQVEVEKLEKPVQVEEICALERSDKFQFEEEVLMNNVTEQMKKACESINHTMGSSLKNIEVQLVALWAKFEEIEAKKALISPEVNVVPEEKSEDEVSVSVSVSKPKIKKRFNKTLKNTLKTKDAEVKLDKETMYRKSNETMLSSSRTRYDDLDRIDIMEEEPVKAIHSITVVKSANAIYETEETDSEGASLKIRVDSPISVNENDEEKVPIKNIELGKIKSLSTLGKRSITSLRKASLFSGVRKNLRKEIVRLLAERFADLGLSLEWKGIPEQTYVRTMDIVNHQANLMHKSYPDYKSIRKKLLKTVEEEVNKKDFLGKQINVKKTKVKKHKTKGVASSLRSSNDPSSTVSVKKPQSAPQVEINRKIFESDTSSDEHSLPQPNSKFTSTIIKRTTPYSAVIEELKQTQKSQENLSQPLMVKSATTITKENTDDEIEKIDIQTKSVLKNFPSRPIPKKRVLFDLKSENAENQKQLVKDAGGGSSTSVASSVLDISDDDTSNMKDNEKHGTTKDIIDLSDSDYSIFDSTGKKGRDT